MSNRGGEKLRKRAPTTAEAIKLENEVALEALHAVQDRQLGALQPVGEQILGQHTARHVQHKNQVASAAL